MVVDCLICIRREDRQQHELFSYSSLEERIPADHPLRPIRTMVDEALQMLYSVRSERMLMEQLEYNLLFPLVRGDVGERAGVASDGCSPGTATGCWKEQGP